MNRSAEKALSVVFVLGVYYGIQWATGMVELASVLRLDPALAATSWVDAIDHHLVQLFAALACIGLVGSGRWRAWGLNLEGRRKTVRWLTKGFFPILVAFLFLGELLVPIATSTPPTFDYELSVLNVAGTLLFMGVVSGLSEEILFRGFVQTFLSRFFGSTLPLFGHDLPVAGLIAAVIFTVAHVGFTLSPIGIYHLRPEQLVLAFVLGIYYAVVYHDTGSLLGPILAHNVVNGTIITATFLSAWALGTA